MINILKALSNVQIKDLLEIRKGSACKIGIAPSKVYNSLVQ